MPANGSGEVRPDQTSIDRFQSSTQSNRFCLMADAQHQFGFYSGAAHLAETSAIEHGHVLMELQMPDRYEGLEAAVGQRVAELLVEPAETTLEAFRQIGQHCRVRREGQFAPIVGSTGVGKTTLSRGLRTFLPELYTMTCRHESAVTPSDLKTTIARHKKSLRANDNKVIPLLIDDREAAPPSPAELAAIKGFLRDPDSGSRCVVIWPDTSRETASQIATNFSSAAGSAIVEFPVEIEGPSRDVWQEVATHTMEVVNSVSKISDLGIDPHAYEPGDFETLGDFLRAISQDFVRVVDAHLSSSQKRLTLVIVFASETLDAGILSQLCSPKRYGLIDSSTLLSASPGSDIGEWWGKNRGMLTQVLLRLNARVFSLSPSASVPILQKYGPTDISKKLVEAGRKSISPAQVNERFSKSDLGRFLTNKESPTRESRGNPAKVAQQHFRQAAALGFNGARDKGCNKGIRDAVEFLLKDDNQPFISVSHESKLGFADLVPDVSVQRESEVACIEFTWRTGDWLQSNNRASAAIYIMQKLRNYAESLKWV